MLPERNNLDLASQNYVSIKGKFHNALPCMYVYNELDLFRAFQALFHVTSIPEFLHFKKSFSTIERNASPLWCVVGEFFHSRKSERAERTNLWFARPSCSQYNITNRKTGGEKTTFITNNHNIRKKIKWFQFHVDLRHPSLFFSLGRMPGLWLC